MLDYFLLVCQFVSRIKTGKKLSYREGTVRCAMSVNLCCARATEVIKVSNSKSDFKSHSRALATVQYDRSHTIFS